MLKIYFAKDCVVLNCFRKIPVCSATGVFKDMRFFNGIMIAIRQFSHVCTPIAAC